MTDIKDILLEWHRHVDDDNLRVALADAADEIERLRSTLRTFAKLADHFDSYEGEESESVLVSVRIAQIRRARELMRTPVQPSPLQGAANE